MNFWNGRAARLSSCYIQIKLNKMDKKKMNGGDVRNHMRLNHPI